MHKRTGTHDRDTNVTHQSVAGWHAETTQVLITGRSLRIFQLHWGISPGK